MGVLDRLLAWLIADTRKAMSGAECSGLHVSPSTGEDVVEACGKMGVLDRLLARLKARGHRVVLFSQYNRMLGMWLHIKPCGCDLMCLRACVASSKTHEFAVF